MSHTHYFWVRSGCVSSMAGVSSGQLTSEYVGKVCEESCERMQLVADILLLKSGNTTSAHTTSAQSQDKKRLSVLEPVSGGNESYSKLRDTIIAGTKVLAISMKEFGYQMNLRSLNDIKVLAEKIAERAIDLTEHAASAAYCAALTDVCCTPAKPGVVSRYSFERAKQDLHLSYNKFKPGYGYQLSSRNILDISKTFADNLSMLTRSCTRVSVNESVDAIDRAQFAACSQSLQSATATFLTALKLFASLRTEGNCNRCLLFGKPLLAVVNSIVEFSYYPQFSGKPAILSHKGQESQIDILGGAMAVISSCMQLLDTSKSILGGDTSDKKRVTINWQKLANCMKSVSDSAKLLSASIRGHTPSPSRRPSADFT